MTKLNDRLLAWQEEAGVLRYLLVTWFFHLTVLFAEPSWQSTFFNWGSVVLEIVGGGIVLWQLNDMSAKFKSKSIFQRALGWFRRCPAWSKPKSVTLQVDPMTINVSVSSPELQVELEQTLEQIVDFLTSEIKRLDSRINDTNRELSGELKKIKKEQSTLSCSLQDVKSELQDALVGDVHWEVFGALIIAQGVIMGAMA